jgi:hypothetical protein
MHRLDAAKLCRSFPDPGPPMLYAILIHASEDAVEAMTPEEDDAHIAEHLKIREKLAAQNKLGPAVRLMPTRTARQLHTAGETAVIDGPFAETKEQLLGFYVVDCESADEAMQIARSLPSIGSIFEIRPVKRFFPGNELPAQASAGNRSGPPHWPPDLEHR